MVKNRKIIPFLNCEGDYAAVAVAVGINALVILELESERSKKSSSRGCKMRHFSNFNFFPLSIIIPAHSIRFFFASLITCLVKKMRERKIFNNIVILCRNFIDFYITLYFISIAAFFLDFLEQHRRAQK